MPTGRAGILKSFNLTFLLSVDLWRRRAQHRVHKVLACPREMPGNWSKAFQTRGSAGRPHDPWSRKGREVRSNCRDDTVMSCRTAGGVCSAQGGVRGSGW